MRGGPGDVNVPQNRIRIRAQRPYDARMADPNKRDIYHQEESAPALPPEEKARIASDPLEIINEAIRHDRLSLLRFWAIALAFAFLIGLLFWQSWKLHNQPRAAETGPAAAVPVEPVLPENVVPTLVDELPVFPHVDALYDLATPAITSPSNRIDTARLKTAAKALVRAESHFGAGDYKMAAQEYEQVTKALPGLGGINEYLAVCRLQNQEHNLAIKAFEQALVEQPNSPSLLNNVGTAHLSLGNYREAGPYLQRCVQLRPRYPLAHYNLGWMYTQEGKTADAARHLKILLDLKPDHGKGLQLYANALLAEKRWPDASRALKQIVDQIPDAASPRFKLAQAHGEENELDEAMLHLEAAIALVDRETARKRLVSPEFVSLQEHKPFQNLLKITNSGRR